MTGHLYAPLRRVRKLRERVIERYLHQQVTAHGGTTRKMKGRKNDCDRLVIWRGLLPFGKALVHFVETKAPGKKARAGQEREHARLRSYGCAVQVLDTKQKVDNYVRQWRVN